MHMIHKHFQRMNTTIKMILTLNLDPFQKSLHTIHISLILNMHLTPFCDEDLFDQHKWEYKDTHNKSNDQVESDDLIRDAHVPDALRYALIDLWTVSPHLTDRSPLPNFQPRPKSQQRQIALIHNQNSPQLQVTPDIFTRFLHLSKNLPLKNKRKRLYFTMDFEELIINWFIDTGALSCANQGDDLRNTRLLAQHTKLNQVHLLEFQIMVTDGQLEVPIVTVE